MFVWVFSLVSVVLVRHTDGWKVQRSRVVFNFASSFGWVVVVVFMFSCVSKLDTICFVWVIVETSGSYRRDRLEFQQISVHGTNPRVCFHFECGRGSLQAWTAVDLMVMVRGVLYLAVDVVLHAASKDVFSVLAPHG